MFPRTLFMSTVSSVQSWVYYKRKSRGTFRCDVPLFSQHNEIDNGMRCVTIELDLFVQILRTLFLERY